MKNVQKNSHQHAVGRRQLVSCPRGVRSPGTRRTSRRCAGSPPRSTARPTHVFKVLQQSSIWYCQFFRD